MVGLWVQLVYLQGTPVCGPVRGSLQDSMTCEGVQQEFDPINHWLASARALETCGIMKTSSKGDGKEEEFFINKRGKLRQE